MFPSQKMVAFVLALHQSSVWEKETWEHELNSVCVPFNATLRPSDANMDSDSLTGEDSLLDCSLLSNPAADLVDEFAPVAFAAQPHKGKTVPLSLNTSWSWDVVCSCHEVKLIPAHTIRCSHPCSGGGFSFSPSHCFVSFPSWLNLECTLKY